MNIKFPRLNEVASLHQNNEKSRFYKFRETFDEEPEFIQLFTKIENELSELDDESWHFLKKEAADLCIILDADKRRGWTKLFEKLNEAKGYGFLKSKGFSNINFIPSEKRNGIETPDLKAWQGISQKALCEVKTKNISKDLVDATEKMTAYDSQDNLSPGLKNILEKIFSKANSQLNSYTEFSNPEKFIYLIIEYDDSWIFKKELDAKTRELFNSMKLIGVNLVIHNES